MSDCRGFPHERLHQDGSREKEKKILTIPTRIGIVKIMSIKTQILKFVKIYQSHLTLRQKTIVIIALIVWSIWLNTLGIQEAIAYCYNHWEIALTMMFGSIIAGGTSMGGGAVAFPVFTKLLNVSPHDAKVFSLAIQSGASHICKKVR